MTAEEKLQELYKACKGEATMYDFMEYEIFKTTNYNTRHLAPEHIDLIADLVKERLGFIYPCHMDKDGNVLLADDTITKLADLVVERMNETKT